MQWPLLMRARCPALPDFGVRGTMADPVLELHEDIANGVTLLQLHDAEDTAASRLVNVSGHNHVKPATL